MDILGDVKKDVVEAEKQLTDAAKAVIDEAVNTAVAKLKALLDGYSVSITLHVIVTAEPKQ